MTSPDLDPGPGGRLVHRALVVDGEATVRDVLVPAIREAQRDVDGVFVVLPGDRAREVRHALDGAAADIEWGDASAFYPRLGFAYEGFRRLLAKAHAEGRKLHVFAQPDLAATADGPVALERVSAYLAYEAMCNEAYAPYGCDVTCVWDVERYPTLVIEDARQVHPHELTAAGVMPSATYVAAPEYLAGRDQVPLPMPQRVDWRITVTNAAAIASLRSGVELWARNAGFSPTAAGDVVIAVDEVVTNGLEYGDPPVQLSGWTHADTLIVQVDDHGAVAIPVGAGYRVPSPLQATGRGLWLARQLADIVQTHTTATTTSVRLTFPSNATHANPDRAWWP